MTVIEAVILGLIEGLTEFLPVSSTGHMILASAFMGNSGDEFVKSFEIAIQLGAILSVLVIYYKKFLVTVDIYIKLGVAFLPAGVVGFLLYRQIKAYLMHPSVVSLALIIGGILLILLDRWTATRESKYESVEKISYGGALLAGIVQCLSMIPGVSRAAAAIFGGIMAGLDRRQATEFSFLLAIPTMLAATGYDLLKMGTSIDAHGWFLLGVGGMVSFVSALLAVRLFITFVPRIGFKYFGYYRIILGVVFLLLARAMKLSL